MATWTKIKPGAGRGGLAPREQFAVMRTRSGHRAAALIVPRNMPESQAERCSVYSDGNGKLAFAFGERGEFSVFAAGPHSASRKVTIPAALADRIPYGTTDVSVIRDGDMIVLDLTAIPASR